MLARCLETKQTVYLEYKNCTGVDVGRVEQSESRTRLYRITGRRPFHCTASESSAML